MLSRLRVTAFLAALALCTPQAGRADPAAPPTAFERSFGDRFLQAYWPLHPDQAIAVGYYQVADRLVVPDAASRAEQLRFADRWLRRLHQFAPQSLDASDRADQALLENELQSERWYLREFRDWEWNPANYNVAEPFALILQTDYAPLDQRLRTVLKRLARVPDYYRAARASIRQPTHEHTQLAISQNQGALDVLGPDLETKVAGSGLSAQERALFQLRLADARTAIRTYIGWLKALDAQQERSGGARSFRIGAALYERKFAYDVQSGGSAQALYERARAEKEKLLARMDQLTGQLWPQYFAATPMPADRLDRIGRMVAKLSEQHVARDKFFSSVQALVPELSQWIDAHGLIGLDRSKPLEVRITPTYEQGVAIASIEAPGPYDPQARTYFNVTPLDTYSPERAESFLREYNRWVLPILIIHEAIPGHYVQLVYANRSPSRIRSIFGNGAMIEGWAVYTERMMVESGYGGGTPEQWLLYSKWNLRSVCNTLLDYGVHVQGMSQAQAHELLTREAFQSEEEANAKWRRVQLTSVQLTSYFSGYSEIYDYRERLKREQGERFSLKDFHERFLSYGSAPVKLIRELMGDGGR